ncbi:transposase [Streptomyces buecherae]|uniref:Transposase n=1 Tax=Streptomyces buecherae TaxID=2763006 RepID=A0A7H8NG68_9ACTN|nr:transposase [Streptomyces buecherae]
MGAHLSRRLVPDGLWELAAPLLPGFTTRRQGGGSAPLDDRTVFTAIVYVLTSGCSWRHLPPSFRVSPATAHRRFGAWTQAGVWSRLRATVEEHDLGNDREWAVAVVDAALSRARQAAPRGTERGPRGPGTNVSLARRADRPSSPRRH